VPSEIRSMAAGVQAMTKQRPGGTPDKRLRLHAGVGAMNGTSSKCAAYPPLKGRAIFTGPPGPSLLGLNAEC